MFKGFNLKYPEYEVITPQTKLSFTVRSLNVQEEERLKGSILTPQKITEHLNKCLYESLVTKPEVIKDFKTFLENVTLKDRDALLYGLYHGHAKKLEIMTLSVETVEKIILLQ